jgi:hypothetical protein
MDSSRPTLSKNLIASCVPITSVDTDFVVSAPNQKRVSQTLWTCAICLGVPRDPVMLRTCGHIGCGTCLTRIYRRRFALYDSQKRLPTSHCPICRAIFAEADMLQYGGWQILAKGAFSCVELACPKSSIDGYVACDFVGSMQDLVEHELRACGNRYVKCPNLDCLFEGTYNKLQEHFQQCDRLMIRCRTCCLPTLWSANGEHQCIEALRGALLGKIR